MKGITIMTRNDFEKCQTEINEIVDTLTVDDSIRTGNMSVRIGNVIYDLTPSAKQLIADEDEIRKELEEKMTIKRHAIKEAVKEKLNLFSMTVESIKSEYYRKEKLLKDTLSTAVPMPNITWEHAKKGLSVVRGFNRGELLWFVRRTYWPKYVNFKPIETTYVKKMMTNIYIMIATTDDTVTSISTRNMKDLEYFDHYHQTRPDCWGSWVKPTRWTTPDDIVKIADDACSILENINTMSIARRNPSKMPRLETLRNHIIENTTNTATPVQEVRVSAAGIREGLGSLIPDDVWGN